MGEQLTWAFIKGQTKTIATETVAKRNSKSDLAALSPP